MSTLQIVQIKIPSNIPQTQKIKRFFSFFYNLEFDELTPIVNSQKINQNTNPFGK
tara:strand:+ start:1604 stop:1768 length:165 start_codon:yes stop_codon:yes gene_type:complete